MIAFDGPFLYIVKPDVHWVESKFLKAISLIESLFIIQISESYQLLCISNVLIKAIVILSTHEKGTMFHEAKK